MRSTFRTALVAMLAVLALGAVAASAAQAEEAPHFKVSGLRLAHGESAEVKAASGSKFETTTEQGFVRTVCNVAFASGAKLLGSNAGEPGTIEMTLDFSACKVGGDGEHCTVEVKPTVPMKAMLVDLEKGGKKGDLGAYIYPAKGKTIADVQFSREGTCIGKGEGRLEGSIAAELTSGGKAVEIGKEPAEAKTLEFRFPGNPIKHVWKITGGEGKEVAGIGLLNFEEAAGVEGNIGLELGADPSWGAFD